MTLRHTHGVEAGKIMEGKGSIWTREIVLVFGATFLVYSNISVFFYFYEYLRTLPIDPKWYGLLISIFSAVPLAVRPVISPFFHTGNAYRFLYIGIVLLMISLGLYSLVAGFWSMLLVRGLHGFSFVLLGTALMTITVDFIPKGRSAQFFGLMSVIVLIPNTIVPPILPLLTRSLGGFTGVLIVFALITAFVFPVASRTRKAATASMGSSVTNSLSRAEVWEDLRDFKIVCILLSMLLLYSGHALVFFFLDGYGKHLGIAGTGFFLTLSTAGEIGVRIAAGSLFDRVNKARLALASMTGLAPVYAALAHVNDETSFFAVGLLLGLGWGIAMPVFNALMFDVSRPRLRAFNTNLGFQMFQGGFFLGPFIGAPMVSAFGFSRLFELCILFSLISAGLTFMVGRRIVAESGDQGPGIRMHAKQ